MWRWCVAECEAPLSRPQLLLCVLLPRLHQWQVTAGAAALRVRHYKSGSTYDGRGRGSRCGGSDGALACLTEVSAEVTLSAFCPAYTGQRHLPVTAPAGAAAKTRMSLLIRRRRLTKKDKRDGKKDTSGVTL